MRKDRSLLSKKIRLFFKTKLIKLSSMGYINRFLQSILNSSVRLSSFLKPILNEGRNFKIYNLNEDIFDKIEIIGPSNEVKIHNPVTLNFKYKNSDPDTYLLPKYFIGCISNAFVIGGSDAIIKNNQIFSETLNKADVGRSYA